jgi:hypothetical protein
MTAVEIAQARVPGTLALVVVRDDVHMGFHVWLGHEHALPWQLDPSPTVGPTIARLRQFVGDEEVVDTKETP